MSKNPRRRNQNINSETNAAKIIYSSCTRKSSWYIWKVTIWNPSYIIIRIYYLYLVKKVTRKVYKTIINLVKVQYKMNTILTNSENSKTSNPHRLLLNLSDKIDWYVSISSLSIYYTWENTNSHAKTIDSKYQLKHGMANLCYLTNRILHQILKINLRISSKNMKQWLIIF